MSQWWAVPMLLSGGLLVGSVAVLVPIQRRLTASGSAPPAATLERLRTRWLGGHLVRTAVALVCFAFAVVAVVLRPRQRRRRSR
jgi:hypothetical protein